MRYLFWLLLIFAVAALAAVTLGRNDGIVAIAWQGWRLDVSLNLFLATLVVGCVLLVMALQALDSLLSLPQRAREWRVTRKDRAAQAALREALGEHLAGRFRRAQKAAQRSAAIMNDTPELDRDGSTRKLALLLSASSAHELQDRSDRDRHMAALEALQTQPLGKISSTTASEAAQLMAARWALDDRDAGKALALLEALPPGVARRTQALRLKLQAQRLDGKPLAALHTARLLAKHQAFAPHVVQGLMRSLAAAAMDGSRDADQAHAAWAAIDAKERQDPIIAAHAARTFVKHGRSAFARSLIDPLWPKLQSMASDERAALAHALTASWDRVEGDELESARDAVSAAKQATYVDSQHAAMPEGALAVPSTSDAGSDTSTWLQRMETATRQLGQDAAVALAAGTLYAQRRLWGKALPVLEQAARSPTLEAPWRQRAWRRLGDLARAQNDEARAQRCDQQAAALGAADAA